MIELTANSPSEFDLSVYTPRDRIESSKRGMFELGAALETVWILEGNLVSHRIAVSDKRNAVKVKSADVIVRKFILSSILLFAMLIGVFVTLIITSIFTNSFNLFYFSIPCLFGSTAMLLTSLNSLKLNRLD